MGKLILLALLILASTVIPARASAEFKVTAYCLNGMTRSGEWTRSGVIAVDPDVIPLYSTVWVEGLGTFTALDTGGGVHGYHVDFWTPYCDDAIQWGVRYRQVEWW